jgi:hypothetical protein
MTYDKYYGIEITFRNGDGEEVKTICSDKKHYESFIERAESGEIIIIEILGNEMMDDYRESKMLNLQNDYKFFKARYNDFVKRKEDVDRAILQKYIFNESERVRRIFEHKEHMRVTNPKMLYALSVTDMNKFHRLAAPLYEQAGLTTERYDCYKYIDSIKHKLKKAEDSLIEYGLKIISDESTNSNLKALCGIDTYRNRILGLLMELPC